MKIFSVILNVIMAAVVAALVLFFGAWAIALVSVVSVIMIIAWLADMKFTVTKNGEVVGYYQRSTGFIPK